MSGSFVRVCVLGTLSRLDGIIITARSVWKPANDENRLAGSEINDDDIDVDASLCAECKIRFRCKCTWDWTAMDHST